MNRFPHNFISGYEVYRNYLHPYKHSPNCVIYISITHETGLEQTICNSKELETKSDMTTYMTFLESRKKNWENISIDNLSWESKSMKSPWSSR